MLQDVVKSLLLPASKGALPPDSKQIIKRFLSSSDYKKAWEDFVDSRTSAAATSSLYEGLQISSVGEFEGWTSVIIRPSRTTAMSTLSDSSYAITTPPTFNFVYVLSAPTELRLRRYEIEGFPLVGDLPGKMQPRLRSEEVITEGDMFALPAGRFASSLVGDVQNCIFLRFSGPDEFPFVYSFDPKALSLNSVSFADTSMTADHFFVILAKHILGEFLFDGEELQELQKYLGELAVDPAVNVVTRWKALQAVAPLSREDGVSILNSMANEGLPNLAAQAQKHLS